MLLGRRDFVRILGASTGAALLYGTASPGKALAALSAPNEGKDEKAMLYDASKCVGCRACQNACKSWNNLPAESTGYGLIYDNPPDLSARTWTVIKAGESQASGKELLLCKYQCMHCTDAACVEVCPSGALRRHELGFVAYDQELCIGCGYCAEFCPFQVPRLSGTAITGAQRMQKCTFCADRLINGQPPACAEACPTGAITFGNRDELVTAGRERTSELKSSYPNAVFYGENELGGLHVMYVLKDLPASYALSPEPEVPDAVMVKDLIQPLGWAVIGLTVLGLTFNYLVAQARTRHKKEG